VFVNRTEKCEIDKRSYRELVEGLIYLANRAIGYRIGAPINWKSMKQASVSLSTMEVEYAALCEISREVIYVKRILKHMSFEKYVTSLINVFCDRQNVIELLKNAICHKHSKHIDISYDFIRKW